MCDYKDFMGFISLHSRPKCGQLMIKPTSKAGNGSFVIATFGFRPGARTLSDCPTESRIMQALQSTSTSYYYR